MYENPEVIEDALNSCELDDVKIERLKKTGSVKLNTYNNKAYMINNELILEIKILENDREIVEENESLPSIMSIYYIANQESECTAKYQLDEIINSYLKQLK